MNQATPHLGAESSLINSKSSNRRRQPRMCTALTTEGMASTWMSQCIERTNKALECKQRHPVMMEHRRGGTYISNQVRMHACQLTLKHCAYFLFCCRKNPQCSFPTTLKQQPSNNHNNMRRLTWCHEDCQKNRTSYEERKDWRICHGFQNCEEMNQEMTLKTGNHSYVV
jgi:hypothetical protein